MSRKKAIAWWLDEYIGSMPNGAANKEIYEEVFEMLTDSQLESIVTKIETDGFAWPVFIYNMDEARIDVDAVMAVGEKIGVKYFHNLVQTDPVSGQVFETPVQYLCLHVPVCRQSQHLVKKLSTGKGKAVDHLAGQATGDAKSASISLPELTQLDGREMTATPLELIKPRGGDEKAMRSMRKSIRETGGFSMGPIMDAGTKPKAVETLHRLLLSAHLDSEGLDNGLA